MKNDLSRVEGGGSSPAGGTTIDPLGIFLVDDHRLFRDGLGRLLASDGRFRVVGEASSGEEFLAGVETLLAEKGRPSLPAQRSWKDEAGEVADPFAGEAAPFDVALVDIDMPGMGGIETTRRAISRWPAMSIVALSMHGEREFCAAMVEAGAKGFLLKNSSFAEVAGALTAVSAAGTYFSQEIMKVLVGSSRHSVEETRVEPLSEREAEVLPLVCEGLSNLRIAERLFISKRTVDKHRASILAKTGCRNTASLVVYAVKNNLIEI